MAEFCPDCFLEFNPDLTPKDLVTVETVDLCEGCGEIVDEIVLYVITARIFLKVETESVLSI